MTRFHTLGLGLATMLATVSFSGSAHAQVTIIRNQGVGAAPGSVAGGGSLNAIFNEACDWWESALVTTPYTLTIAYQWAPLGGGTLGSHSLTAQGGVPNRETAASIRFDNDGSSSWFLDPTPCDNSEYASGVTNTTANLGGGMLNTGRTMTGGTGSASGRTDMFAVCLHEIGHALGLSNANTSFIAENGDLDVDVTAPRPFPGSTIPTISGAHLNIGTALMFPSISSSLRRLPSDADVLANSQISGMTGINSVSVCPGSGGGGSPLTTTFADNNGGSAGGAVYFALEGVAGGTGATITDIDLNCGNMTVGSAVTIDVYLQAGCVFDPLGTWSLITTGSGITAATGTPSNFVLTTPMSFGEGCCFSVAIVANGFGHRYTTATTLPLTYATTHLELTGGSSSNAPFAGSIFSPRLVNTNIHYTVGGSCGGFATVSSEGVGCVSAKTSFYEVMTPAGMDLGGFQFNAINSASGYAITSQPSTIQPIGSLDPGAPTLGLGDDVQVPVGTLGLTVGSNGQVARGAGNSNQWTPNIGTMLSNPAEAMYAWTDLQPNAAGSGLVTYEESGTQWMVTFDGVYLWGTSDPCTIQFRGNEANGNFTIAFGTLGNSGPQDWLIGYSVAGPSADPGPRDLTFVSLFPFATQAFDQDPLTLAAVGVPEIGQPFDLTTTNVEPGAVFHIGVVGLIGAALPLAFIVPSAHPQCRLNATMDLLVGPVVVLGGPGSVTWQGIDLSGVSLLGVDLFFQAATLDLSILSSSTRTSNAIKATTGF